MKPIDENNKRERETDCEDSVYMYIVHIYSVQVHVDCPKYRSVLMGNARSGIRANMYSRHVSYKIELIESIFFNICVKEF